MTAKGKGGRPPFEITAKVLKKAEEFASQGMTQEQIAASLGMGTSTLYSKLNEYPEFQDAIKRGQALGIATVTNSLFKNANEGKTTAQIFYLKNRAGWADRTDIGLDGGLQVIISETDANLG